MSYFAYGTEMQKNLFAFDLRFIFLAYLMITYNEILKIQQMMYLIL